MKKSKSIEFYMKELEILHEISSVAGARVDFVQGGGGNTSVKLDGELMAVKASGFKLNQVTAAEGYAIVNYKKIAGYFTNVDPQSGIDYEVDCNDFIRKNTVSFEGLKELRPSVEAGFHSILGKCVLHTHSVYANLLCCTEGGQELAAKLFNGAGFTWIWVPYINPGFSLSMEILKASGASVRSGMGFPTVVLMENHGLVVSSQDAAGCNLLNEKVNNLIKEYFGIKESFPSVLLKDNYGDLQGRTGYILEYIKKGAMNENYLDKYVLYPDQIVYLNGSVSFDADVTGATAANTGNISPAPKLVIDLVKGSLTYRTSYMEALTIEETLLSYIFVINEAQRRGLSVKSMKQKDVDFIKNWEIERYRKSVMAGFLQ